jgi:hypothetical protein
MQIMFLNDEVLEGRYLFDVTITKQLGNNPTTAIIFAMQILQHVMADTDCKGQSPSLCPLKRNIYQSCTTLTEAKVH